MTESTIAKKLSGIPPWPVIHPPLIGDLAMPSRKKSQKPLSGTSNTIPDDELIRDCAEFSKAVELSNARYSAAVRVADDEKAERVFARQIDANNRVLDRISRTAAITVAGLLAKARAVPAVLQHGCDRELDYLESLAAEVLAVVGRTARSRSDGARILPARTAVHPVQS
jgi:hypothetical protein